ncbi:MAG: sulfite exporter TauE/SafE family protein [Zestosphaera sp.]
MLLFLAPLVGFAAGVLGSMFGLGGGFLLVPLLNIAGVDMRVAVGTSASAIFFNMLSSTLAYSRYRYVIYRAGLLLSATAIITAYLGAQLTSLLDANTLRVLFGLLLIFVGTRVYLNRGGRSDLDGNRLKWSLRNYAILSLGGSLAGLMAGLLGIGGGVVNVPLLTSLGVAIHYAVATSSMAITLTSITSALTHHTLGNVDLQLLVLLAPSLIIGAQVGASVARRTKTGTLKKGFAVTLWFVAARMVLKGIGLPIP